MGKVMDALALQLNSVKLGRDGKTHLLFLPHVHAQMEDAFRQWQQIVSPQDTISFSDKDYEQSDTLTRSSLNGNRVASSVGIDAKQPFRPEKRYRRR